MRCSSVSVNMSGLCFFLCVGVFEGVVLYGPIAGRLIETVMTPEELAVGGDEC